MNSGNSVHYSTQYCNEYRVLYSTVVQYDPMISYQQKKTCKKLAKNLQSRRARTAAGACSLQYDTVPTVCALAITHHTFKAQ
ncbi:hypothetical protein BC940DRAFT_158798 [Gongronella butleri]|nr:hypothetical protein BC940DRAFT_158798 [Gongronella butleri]